MNTIKKLINSLIATEKRMSRNTTYKHNINQTHAI